MTGIIKPLILPDCDPLEWPQIQSHRCEQTGDIRSASLQLYISKDLVWLKGHFPGQPVLPGVVQVHWAAGLADALFEIPRVFRGIENLKFQSVVLPNTYITLNMTFEIQRFRVNFQYRDAENLFSEGKIKYAENIRNSAAT